jgi:hypothetical protein
MAADFERQINSIASAETTVLKTGFGPGGAGGLLSPSIAVDRTSTGRVDTSARAYPYADTGLMVAMNLHRLGVCVKFIQQILWHANVTTTMNIYVKTVSVAAAP